MLEKELRSEFEVRRGENPAYSIRSFARDLGLSKSTLSRIFCGYQVLSEKSRSRVLERLQGKLAPSLSMLSEEKFSVLEDWYYLAILNLSRLREHRASTLWIAKHLGLSLTETSLALRRLEALGFLKIFANRLYRKTPPLRTLSDRASERIRQYHAKVLRLAALSLKRDPVEKREFQSMCIAIDAKKLPEAKKRIRAFKEDLSHFLESGEPNKIYQLCIQLFPAQGDAT